MKRTNPTPEEIAARKAATDRRLETMRANLAELERRAEAIFAKGNAMTADDRRELLRIVNVAYHTSGKIEGVFSIDSSASCEFCQRMIKAALSHVLMICGSCYAAADAWKEAAWRRHKLNARIFSTVLFTVEELKLLHIDGHLCRFNEDGDTVNATMARNYIRIAAAHPYVMFGYWYKHTAAVEAGLIAEGITRREDRPDNVRFIHSSIFIGFEAPETWYDDAIFTVYPDAETTLEAVAAGAHECNGRRCRACGYTCYTMQRRDNVVRIAEVLRTNASRRAVILAAYRAEKARRAA